MKHANLKTSALLEKDTKKIILILDYFDDCCHLRHIDDYKSENDIRIPSASEEEDDYCDGTFWRKNNLNIIDDICMEDDSDLDNKTLKYLKKYFNKVPFNGNYINHYYEEKDGYIIKDITLRKFYKQKGWN